MKIIAALIFTLYISAVQAVVPPTFKVEDLYKDAKFVGTVNIVSARAKFNPNNPKSVCGVEYEAIVTESILGGKPDTKLSINMLKDIRENQGFNFLEVGSEYFIYAEHRNTHQFVQLSDGLYDFPEYPQECYGGADNLHLYREFSGIIKSNQENRFLSTPGVTLIVGVRELPGAYWPEEGWEMTYGKKSYQEAYREKLIFQGVMLEPFIEFIAQHFARLNKPSNPTP